MSNRLGGKQGTAYLGTNAIQPPNWTFSDRPPTPTDKFNVVIGDLWLDQVNRQVWVLVSLAGNINSKGIVALWVQWGGGGGVTTFPCDVDFAVESGGIVNVYGGTNIQTVGSGNTITINAGGALADTYFCDGGTFAVPVANKLNVIGGPNVNTAGAGNTITINLTNGTDGQVLIAGGTNPVWGNITSLGGTITITNGANTINLETSGAGGTQTYHTDAGDATPSLSVLNIVGGSNINTAGAGNTVTINLNNSVSISGSFSAGTTITAGTGLIVTTGGANITGPVLLNSVGDNGVLQTNNVGLVFADNGTNGQVLIGGGTKPTWNNITSSGGTVAITNGPNSINLEASGGLLNRYAFLACQQSNTAGVLGGFGQFYTLGTAAALTKIFDIGTNFSIGGGGNAATFTAPITGRYYLSMFVAMKANTTPVTTNLPITVELVTSNRSYDQSNTYPLSMSAGSPTISAFWGFSVCADMDIGDTATYILYCNNGNTPNSIFVSGTGATTTLNTYVSGFLAA